MSDKLELFIIAGVVTTIAFLWNINHALGRIAGLLREIRERLPKQ